MVVIGKYANGGHAWNYVEMEDGNLYAVDCTFDDDNNGINYYYFLTASESPDFRSSADETFSQTHIPDGKLSYFTNFSFTYPTLYNVPYADFYLGTDSKAIYIKDKNFLVIPAGAVLENQAYAPTNTFFMAMSNATGTKVNTMSFQTMVQTYCFTLVMQGDVVPDEVVDTSDLDAVRQATVGYKTFSETEQAQFTAGDLNGDGVIDGFDVAKVDLIIYQGQN